MNYIERYWRDATPGDAIKEPPMVARFRDTVQEQWESGYLSGFDRPRSNSTERWWYSSNSAESFNFCQVYDAPDPGEGWRLIDIDKETKQKGDEYLRPDGTWKKADKAPFSKIRPYRRRIAPAVTYVPFPWEDREQLRGRWITRDNQELQLVNLDNSDGFFANGVHVVNLCLYWKFLDTDKPVGKEVVQ